MLVLLFLNISVKKIIVSPVRHHRLRWICCDSSSLASFKVGQLGNLALILNCRGGSISHSWYSLGRSVATLQKSFLGVHELKMGRQQGRVWIALRLFSAVVKFLCSFSVVYNACTRTWVCNLWEIVCKLMEMKSILENVYFLIYMWLYWEKDKSHIWIEQLPRWHYRIIFAGLWY